MVVKKLIKSIVIIGILVWMATGTYLYFFQRNILFVPGTSVPDAAEAGMPDMEVIMLPSSDGLRLLSWYRPARDALPTILYFQGNAGNLETQARLMKPLYDAGYGLFMLGYRGYGGNAGEPTEEGFIADARASLQYIRGRGVNDDEIVLYGRSLGTGVATQIATEIEARGLILQAPFTSVPDMGAERYPWLPVRLLARDQFNTIDKIAGVGEPLFIYWGSADRTVPPHHPAAVFAAAREPKAHVIIEGAGHSNLFRIGGNDAVLAWLAALP